MRAVDYSNFELVAFLPIEDEVALGYWAICLLEGGWEALEQYKQDPFIDNDTDTFRKKIKRKKDLFQNMFGINIRSMAHTNQNLALALYVKGYISGQYDSKPINAPDKQTQTTTSFPKGE